MGRLTLNSFKMNTVSVYHVYRRNSYGLLIYICTQSKGNFCPSLGNEFQPHSQSKIATFFTNMGGGGGWGFGGDVNKFCFDIIKCLTAE